MTVPDSFSPTSAMKDEAQRGLDWRNEFNRGGTEVGVARARDIVNGRALSLDTVKRMASYFARHEVDKQGQGWSPDEEGYPSAGRIAWALWGGDPGRRWALAIITESEGRSDDPQENYRMDVNEETRDMEDSVYPLSPRQNAQYDADEQLVEVFGKYDQGNGPDGAHYVAASPFAGDGLVCSSCAFYEGPRGCEIVDGDIDPSGICKRWVIPAELLTAGDPAPADMPADGGPRAHITPVETRKVNGRDVEFRMMTAPLQIEERAVDTAGPVKFVGYAAVFDSPSERLWDPRHGEFVETISRSAFNRTLAAKREVRMYVNHNSDMVLSSTRSGTLTLSVDERGLRVESDLPDTSYARDLEALMRSGVVDSMSFGFSIPTGGDAWSADGSSRELREIILHEVSVVTGFPAYPDTAGASVRTSDDPEEGDDEDEVIGVPVMLARRINDLYAKKA